MPIIVNMILDPFLSDPFLSFVCCVHRDLGVNISSQLPIIMGINMLTKLLIHLYIRAAWNRKSMAYKNANV